MTIAYQSASTLAYGSTSVAANYPSSLAANELILLLVGTKPNTASITTPTGFLKIGEFSGGSGTTGADTGPTKIAAFMKFSTGSESGTISVAITNGNSSWAQMYRYSSTSNLWDVAGTGGTDSSTGSAWSVTCDVDPDIKAGDHILVGSCIPTDVSTPSQFSSENVTVSGATLDSMSELSEPDSATGNDVGGFVFRMECSAGSSAGIPVITATAGGTTSNVRGPSILVRIRETDTAITTWHGNDGDTLPFWDDVTEFGGGNGTGSWVYSADFDTPDGYGGTLITITSASAFNRLINLCGDLTDCWFCGRFQYGVLPSSNCTIIQARSGTTTAAEVRMNVGGKLRMRNASTQVGSDFTNAIATDTPYYWSWHVVNGTGQSLYLYDDTGTLIESQVNQTYNQGSFNNLSVGQVSTPGNAMNVRWARVGYKQSAEITPPVPVLSTIGFFGIPM